MDKRREIDLGGIRLNGMKVESGMKVMKVESGMKGMKVESGMKALDLFNSDFSDEEKDQDILSVKIAETENEEIDLSEVSDEEDSNYILLTEDENIRIKDEKIIFIATNKNTTIKLPHLKGCNPIKKKNGKLYKTKKIVIKALREQYSHNVFPAKKNTINGNAGIYMLRGGMTVTFYSLDKSWYADR